MLLFSSFLLSIAKDETSLRSFPRELGDDAGTKEFDTNYRSTLDLLWTCILTIFACTWISVHPNVVGYKSTWRQTFAARLELMLWAIFAPELIVVFAFRQWGGARKIGIQMRRFEWKSREAWTDAHSHMLQMGGFIFREGDGCTHYVDLSSHLGHCENPGSGSDSEELASRGASAWSAVATMQEYQPQAPSIHPLHSHNHISSSGPQHGETRGRVPPPPSISSTAISLAGTGAHIKALLRSGVTKEEIWDKSKGDAFAKAFVIVQTSWFVVQCCARAAQGLDLTHLEITTIAYAALNGVMYFFWWNKPLDVQYPIIIDLAYCAAVGEKEPRNSVEPTTVPRVPDPVLHAASVLTKVETSERFSGVLPSNHNRKEIRQSRLVSAARRMARPPLKLFKVSFWTRGTRIILRRTDRIFSRLQSIVEYNRRERSSSLIDETEFPTFYALPLAPPLEAVDAGLSANHSFTQLMGLILASAFGAIHCLAWNFGAPTSISNADGQDSPSGSSVPQILWRASALSIAVSPFFLIFSFLFVFFVQWPVRRSLRSWYMRPLVFIVIGLKKIGESAILIYIPARIILVVLAFRELWYLTPSMHKTVEWSSFVPHI